MHERAHDHAPAARRGRLCLLTFVGFLCVYLFTATLRIESIDGDARFEVSAALLRKGSPAPDNGFWLQSVMVHGKHAEWVSYYGLGHSLLAVPLIAAGARLWPAQPRLAGKLAFCLVNALCAAAAVAAFLAVLLALGYGPRLALCSALLLGLGSCLWPAAQSCMEGPQVALCLLLLCLAIAWRRGAAGPGPLALAAASMGWLGLTRETDAAAAMPLLVALLLSRPGDWRQRARDLAVLALCGLPFLLLYCGYNEWRYGSLLSLRGRMQVLLDHHLPVYGNPLVALYGLTLGAEKGFVFFSPLVTLGVAGLIVMRRDQRGLVLAIAATFVFTVATLVPLAGWRGDATWGPRYLFGVAPLLHLGLPEALRRAAGPLRRGALALLVSAALLAQVGAVSLYPMRYFIYYGLSNDHIYGQLPPERRPPSQLLYHLRELPGVVARTAARLAGPPASVELTPPRSEATRAAWAERYAAFDCVPFFWIYYDLATGGRVRVPLRGAAALLALGALLCLAFAARAARGGRRLSSPSPAAP